MTAADSLWTIIEQQRRLTNELAAVEARRAELLRGLERVERSIAAMRERVMAEAQAEYLSGRGE